MVLLEMVGDTVLQYIELMNCVLLSRSLISLFSYSYSKALNSLFRASVFNHLQTHDFLFTFAD
jgi:hypothetical protein